MHPILHPRRFCAFPLVVVSALIYNGLWKFSEILFESSRAQLSFLSISAYQCNFILSSAFIRAYVNSLLVVLHWCTVAFSRSQGLIRPNFFIWLFRCIVIGRLLPVVVGNLGVVLHCHCGAVAYIFTDFMYREQLHQFSFPCTSQILKQLWPGLQTCPLDNPSHVSSQV